MSFITNKWNDGSGDSINIESPSFQGNQTIKISSPVQKGTSKRSIKFIGKCKKDSSKQVILTVEQEASTYTYDLTLNSDNTEIAAKGGTATITAVLKTYRNGNLVSTDNVTPVLLGSATGFSISGTTVTASNRTTVVGAERSITVTGKYSGTYDGQEVSATVVVKQEANYIESLKIGGGSTTRYLPTTITYSAAGGSNPFTGWGVYTSGSKLCITTFVSGDWVLSQSYFTKSLSGGILTVSGEYRGATVGSERTANLTVNLLSVSTNNKQLSASVTLTQGANSATYGNVTISGGTVADIPASGGKVSSMSGISASQTVSYTSGASRAGSVSISYSTEVSASSLGTTVKARTKVGTLTATASGKGSKSATKVLDVYQQANARTVVSTSGGVTTYGNISVGKITNATIPASGGTATATAGNTTQSWSKSAVTTTYEYTSGSEKDEETTPASSGSNTVTPSVASIEATASSKGTTVSAQNVVKQQVVIWSANGKSATGIMYIYQAANEIVSYNYTEWKIVLRANPTTIPASGGTSQLTNAAIQERIPVYTSGATGSSTTVSSIPLLSISGDGFTLANNIVRASKNNVGARSCIVTASREEAVSQTVTITQSAGPDGIGYMQIQGNGVDHYIFQVGRTPNTRSNDVQTLSEKPVEVVIETKSESLFAKIKRIVTNLN